MKRFLLTMAVMALIIPTFITFSYSQDDNDKDTVNTKQVEDISSTPPAGFKKVSSIIKLPEFVPGLGILYADPATMPVGPYLGYDKNNKLVNIVYMVPLKQLDEHKDLQNLGALVGGQKIDHTDIVFNPGHEGLSEPHYHVIQWLINSDEVEKRIKNEK